MRRMNAEEAVNMLTLVLDLTFKSYCCNIKEQIFLMLNLTYVIFSAVVNNFIHCAGAFDKCHMEVFR